MPRPAFPKSLREFQRQFATEDACEQYLAASRWPDGFLCERCGGRDAYVLVDRRRWQCHELPASGLAYLGEPSGSGRRI